MTSWGVDHLSTKFEGLNLWRSEFPSQRNRPRIDVLGHELFAPLGKWSVKQQVCINT
jgi:hypothetical protein